MAVSALIPAIGLVVVFVPGLEAAGPGAALFLGADHFVGFLCLSRAALRFELNPVMLVCTPG